MKNKNILPDSGTAIERRAFYSPIFVTRKNKTRSKNMSILRPISWQHFSGALVVLSAAYYLAMLILFYKKEIRLFAEGKLFAASAESGTGSQAYTKKDAAGISSSVHDLIEELKIVFASAAKKTMAREELIALVKDRLKRYPQLKGSEIQPEISQHIAIQASEMCSIELNAEESSSLWEA